jgi:hypothetical protein
MKTDEYGCVHNDPETYSDLAYRLQDHDPQIFQWGDDRMSMFTLLLHYGVNPAAPFQRYLYVGVERKGFFGFPRGQYLHPGYVSEKLDLAYGSAEPLADLLNGIMGTGINA